MIFGKRKKEKIKQNIIDNLTLCRLEGDLLAIEAAIRDHSPKTTPESSGHIRHFINEIITKISNKIKRINTQELSVKKEKAQNALWDFRSAHSADDFKISKDADEFRKYIDKMLFKKDHDGIQKLSFALIFAIDDNNREYQCPEESLEVVSEILFDDCKRLGNLYSRYKHNFEKTHHSWPSDFESGLNLGSGLGSALALSVLPICVTGFVTLVNYLRKKKETNIAFKNLSANETNATFAFYLTLIEEFVHDDQEKQKEMVDELLKKLDNVRADAEYKWFVEGVNIPDCKQKIEVCDLTLNRLGEILGR